MRALYNQHALQVVPYDRMRVFAFAACREQAASGISGMKVTLPTSESFTFINWKLRIMNQAHLNNRNIFGELKAIEFQVDPRQT